MRSLAAKLLVVLGMLALASIGALTFLATQAVQEPMRQNLVDKGTAMTQELSASVGEALATGDELLIASYVDEAKKQSGVLYAVTLDPQGRVIAHSDVAVPKGSQLSDALSSEAENATEIQVTETVSNGQPAFDFHVVAGPPGKPLGAVRLGLSQFPVQESVRNLTKALLTAGAAILAIALAAAWILARVLARPVERLTRAVDSIAGGNFDVEIAVKSQDEVGRLADRFRFMTEQLKAGRQTLLHQQQLRDELDLAQKIQQTLLPRQTPYLEGYELAAHYVPAKEVSGDYFDIFWVDADRLGIVVADVCGKGVPAALLMVSCRAELRYLARGEPSAAQVLRQLNRTLMASTDHGKTFVTLLYAILDVSARRLTFANAGHTPLYLVNPTTGREGTFGSHALPLGTDFPDLFDKQIRDEQILLATGDLAFLYTDGLSELGRPNGPAGWDEAHVHQLVAARARDQVANLLLSLQSEADRVLQGAPYSDDLTMVGLKVRA